MSTTVPQQPEAPVEPTTVTENEPIVVTSFFELIVAVLFKLIDKLLKLFNR